MKVIQTQALAELVRLLELCPLMDLLAVVAGYAATIYRVTTLAKIFTLRDTSCGFTAVSWAQRGRLLAIGCSDTKVHIVHVEMGEVVRTFSSRIAPEKCSQRWRELPLNGPIVRLAWISIDVDATELKAAHLEKECLPIEPPSGSNDAAAHHALIQIAMAERQERSCSSVLIALSSSLEFALIPDAFSVGWVGAFETQSPSNAPWSALHVAFSATTGMLVLCAQQEGQPQRLFHLSLATTASQISSTRLTLLSLSQEYAQYAMEQLAACVFQWQKCVDAALRHVFGGKSARPIEPSERIGMDPETHGRIQFVKNALVSTITKTANISVFFSGIDAMRTAGQYDVIRSTQSESVVLVQQQSYRALDWALALCSRSFTEDASTLSGVLHCIHQQGSAALKAMALENYHVLLLLRYAVHMARRFTKEPVAAENNESPVSVPLSPKEYCELFDFLSSIESSLETYQQLRPALLRQLPTSCYPTPQKLAVETIPISQLPHPATLVNLRSSTSSDFELLFIMPNDVLLLRRIVPSSSVSDSIVTIVKNQPIMSLLEATLMSHGDAATLGFMVAAVPNPTTLSIAMLDADGNVVVRTSTDDDGSETPSPQLLLIDGMAPPPAAAADAGLQRVCMTLSEARGICAVAVQNKFAVIDLADD